MEELTVRDAMTEEPVQAGPGTTVKEAAHILVENDISSLPVCTDDALEGFVTSEDIVERVLVEDSSPDTELRDIMTETPVTTSPDTSLEDAMAEMGENGINRLLVLEDRELVGVMTDGDALRLAPDMISVLYEEIEELKEDVGVQSTGDMCESCGNYSPNLEMVDGQLICPECQTY